MIKIRSIVPILLASLLALSPASSLAASSSLMKQYAVAVPEVITSEGDASSWGNDQDVIEKGVSGENSAGTTASPTEGSPTTDDSNSAHFQ